MEIIYHRRNTIEELILTSKQYGVEIDIRSDSKDLILHHDPFKKGDLLKDWLCEYDHGTLILNVKEEGLEDKIINLIDRFRIKNYFFLDQSFPFLFKYSQKGMKSSAIRVSEFESFNTALNMREKVEWLWIDYFTHCPLNKNICDQIKKSSYKVCIVSPELQGYQPDIHIPKLREKIIDLNFSPDSVCTKNPNLWES